MNIALDYDGTYTLNPEFWDSFIEKSVAEGHDIRVVTVRDDRYDRTPDIAELEFFCPVVFTRGVAKKWYCEQFLPFWGVDVWIDDRPESVFKNSELDPEGLLKWRLERGEGGPVPQFA